MNHQKKKEKKWTNSNPPDADSFVKPRESRTMHETDQFSGSLSGTERTHLGTSPRYSDGDNGAKQAAGQRAWSFSLHREGEGNEPQQDGSVKGKTHLP